MHTLLANHFPPNFKAIQKIPTFRDKTAKLVTIYIETLGKQNKNHCLV
ncbi:MAG: hypothetical protein PVI40_05285 [Chlamydiota bacterium]|jgi:hypothetical protein